MRTLVSSGRNQFHLYSPEINQKPGRTAKCRQKVCSSKRPAELEPRSVRPNEVFENLACRISLNNRESVKAEVFEKRVFRANDPIQNKK